MSNEMQFLQVLPVTAAAELMECEVHDIMPSEYTLNDVKEYLFVVENDNDITGDFYLLGKRTVAYQIGNPARLFTSEVNVFKSANDTDSSLYITYEDFENKCL